MHEAQTKKKKKGEKKTEEEEKGNEKEKGMCRRKTNGAGTRRRRRRGKKNNWTEDTKDPEKNKTRKQLKYIYENVSKTVCSIELSLYLLWFFEISNAFHWF